jgi:hypothetical protein
MWRWMYWKIAFGKLGSSSAGNDSGPPVTEAFFLWNVSWKSKLEAGIQGVKIPILRLRSGRVHHYA